MAQSILENPAEPISQPFPAAEADDLLPVPEHVAVIMDGNGRWAKARNLPRIKGHEKGSESIVECMKGCQDLKVRYLTLYAFSNENWKRPKAEVTALMEMLERHLTTRTDELMEKNVRLHAIGALENLPGGCRRRLEKSMERTAGNDGLNLIFALSYGSRGEIVNAAKALAREVREGTLDPDQIDEDLFSSRLYTAGFPDPDLLIRTSGEMRISNFLLWQISYAELVVTPTLWPDFTREHFVEAVNRYRARKRRFGGV
jgi:undecaprenyl diphosphate synthase